MEGSSHDLEAEKIVQNAYFTAEFSYFLHNPNREIVFENPVTRINFCPRDKILLVLWEASSAVRILNQQCDRLIDYPIMLKGKKSASRVVDFDYDSDNRTVGCHDASLA